MRTTRLSGQYSGSHGLRCAVTACVLFVLLGLTGCAGLGTSLNAADEGGAASEQPGDRGNDATESSAYRLGPGDRVRITVFGHEDLSGEFEVDGAGNLSLPLIRLVEAQGLTTRELETLIAQRLQPDYLRNPRVSADVLGYRPFYILGEVRNPGSYPFVSNMTVVNAVAVAGGYSYRASKKKITIIRATDPEKEKRSITENAPVYPGDVIEVPERFF